MITLDQKQVLQDIADRNGGRLTPSDVVDEARKHDSPLHELFEWDIKKAAQSHWIDRARDIITSVKIEVQTETFMIRSVAYIRDPSAENDEQGYRNIADVRSDKDWSRKSIVEAFQQAAAYLRRAKNLAIVLELDEEVETLINNVVELREKVTHQQPPASM